MKVKKFFAVSFVLLSATLIFTSCGTSSNAEFSSNGEWEEEKAEKSETPSWTIYSRQIPETNFWEFKIEGSVEASPVACVSSVKANLYAEAKNKKKFPTYDFVQDSKDSIQTYVIHNEPFPLKDTEMSVLYEFDESQANRAAVKWREAWEKCDIESTKKLNRVEVFRGTWEFEEEIVGTSSAINTVQFDLKGMPMSLAKPMVQKFLINGLKDLKKRNE